MKLSNPRRPFPAKIALFKDVRVDAQPRSLTPVMDRREHLAGKPRERGSLVPADTMDRQVVLPFRIRTQLPGSRAGPARCITKFCERIVERHDAAVLHEGLCP